jgi:hypothetical protein
VQPAGLLQAQQPVKDLRIEQLRRGDLILFDERRDARTGRASEQDFEEGPRR